MRWYSTTHTYDDDEPPASNARKVGDKMPDGTVYAGSTTLGGVADPPTPANAIYAAPTDAPLAMTFNEAADYAAKLNREIYLGHSDWRVPSKNELNLLFNNRAAIGGFDISGSLPSGWYLSSSRYDKWNAWWQRFSNGYQTIFSKESPTSLRLVRSEPKP